MNVKFASYFMISIMVISTLWIIGIGMLSSSKEPAGGQSTPTPTVEGAFNVPGKLVYAPFGSLEDCLNITPSGVERALFIDPERAENAVLDSYFSSQLSQFSPLYSSSVQETTVQKAYVAHYDNGTTLEMHYIRPKTSSGISYLDVSTYDRYTVLERINPRGYTVLGDPIVYSSEREVLNATLDTLSTHNNTALLQFMGILSVAHNTQLDVMQLVGYTSGGTPYYMGIHPNGTLFERWTFYLSPSDELVDTLSSYSAQGLESGNFTTYMLESMPEDNDVLKVTIDSFDPGQLLLEPHE